MPSVFKPKVEKSAEDQFLQLLTNIQQHTEVIKRLQRQLAEFPKTLDEAGKRFEFLDRKLAETLLDLASDLLAYCALHPDAEAVPYALAAIDYFVRENDAQADFGEIDGFEDDRKVFDAVIEHFQLKNHLCSQHRKRGA